MTVSDRRVLVPAALAGAVLGGVAVTQVQPPVALAGLSFGTAWLIAIALGVGRQFGFVTVAVLTVGLWDVFAGFDMIPILGGLVVVNLAILIVLGGTIDPWSRGDWAAVLIVLASIFPAVVSNDFAVIPGIAVAIGATYASGRVARPSPALVRNTVLAIGTAHAAIAIGSAMPGASGLVPALPNQVPTLRALGLYANPNTLGTVEAMVIALALSHGTPRTLAPFVVICGVGLLLSGSREALIGLAAGLAVLAIRRPGGSVATVALIGIAAAAAITVLPTTLDRFDPFQFATDASLLDRLNSWRAALDVVGSSPLVGHGLALPEMVIDMMYLGWLVTGGLIGTVIWLAAIAMTALALGPSPLLAVVLVAGFLANPLSGASLMLLLLNLAERRLEPAVRQRDAASPDLAPATANAGQ
jgi:O-Antigen ligase